MAKLEARLSPELSVLYSQGYDGHQATPGIRTLEELEGQRATSQAGLVQGGRGEYLQ